MAEVTKVIELVDGTLTNMVDKSSKLSVNYKPVTTWYDGTAMDASKVDGDLYTKKGSKFYRKVIDKDGELFLEKDTMAQMRALTAREILYLRAGVYKGVKLNGYYTAGDTPASIDYYISSTSSTDDGGSVIEVGGIKLEHKFVDGIDIRYFGAKANDDTYGVINFNCIAKIVDKGVQALIEDKFYVTASTYVLTTQIVDLNSISSKGEVITTNAAIWFKLPSYTFLVRCNNIIFKSDDNSSKYIRLFSENSGKADLEYFIFTNNTCYTDVGARHVTSSSFNNHVNNITITNNKYFNTTTTIFQFINVVNVNTTLQRNNIKNLGGSFFYFAYDDKTQIRSNVVDIGYNKVRNDIDYWLKTSSGSYYVFALVSGLECNYYNNHVEGMKAKGRNIALYDIYQSTDKGTYYNNYWKNNCSIDTTFTDVGTRALYKAKGGIFKKCYDNTFILEESYIDEIATLAGEVVDKSRMWYNFGSFDTDDLPVEFYYYNNTVDVYGLTGISVWTTPFKVFKAYNNTFKFSFLQNSIFGVRNADNIGEDRYMHIENNTLVSKSIISTPALGLMMGSADKSLLTDKLYLYVKNNKINNILLRELAYGIKAEYAEFCDNTITVLGVSDYADRNNTLYRICEFNNLHNKNNIINMDSSTLDWRSFITPSSPSSLFMEEGNYEVTLVNRDGIKSMSGSGFNIMPKNYKYDITISANYTIQNDREYSMSYTLTHVYEGGVSKVKYRNLVTNQDEEIVFASDGNFNLNNGASSQTILDSIGPGVSLRLQKIPTNNLVITFFTTSNMTYFRPSFNVKKI